MSNDRTVIIAGGGIGGLATALALSAKGVPSLVLEQAAALGEIGAGLQLGPNAFGALDRLGVGAAARDGAVFIDRLVMMDAVDGKEIATIPVDEPFRKRFGNPYAVTHRADLYQALHDGCLKAPGITLLAGHKVVGFDTSLDGVVVRTENSGRFPGAALVGADGLNSRIREIVVGDGRPRVSGHVTYRAVLPIEEMPADLRWSAATLWAGPDTHLVHYPLRGWKLFNIVATFHSERTTEGHNEPGTAEEILGHFDYAVERPLSILRKPTSWRRWVLCDREPVETWTQGVVTLLGDAAHPMLQYFAQGACMALEDAVCLADEVAVAGGDFARAFLAYQEVRKVRTARVQISSRWLGDVYQAKKMERLVRNSVLGAKSPQQFYDSLAWLYDGPTPRTTGPHTTGK